jgi:hypothetical protein
MSSIAKANISLSKKDLTKSRIPLVASRNVTFYHKATAGDLSINLLALSMPSEMPTNVQATVAEISGANLAINKKNLSLVSSANGLLMSGLHYVVTSSTTIQLIGLYAIAGAEVDEIFTGVINSAPVSDLVVASARSVDKTYELGIGLTTLNLGREYEVGMNPNDDIGSIKVFVNGMLAHRGVEYAEVDAGSGYGTTIQFFTAPVSIPYSVAVDFGVMSITDNDAIGTIENLAGAIKKIAVDLANVAGTSESDYYSANPSEIERRTFGDMVLDHENRIDVLENPSAVAVRAYQSTSAQVIGTVGQVVIYDSKIDTGNLINLATGVFTAPFAGYYWATANVYFTNRAYTVGNGIYFFFQKNGASQSPIFINRLPTFTNSAGVNGSDLYYLLAGETLNVYAQNEAGNTAISQASFSVVPFEKIH